MAKIDSKTLEYEYHPTIGDVGRGRKDIDPSDVDLNGYERYCTPGLTGTSASDISIYPSYGSNEKGYIWTGYVREKNGKHFIVSFERPMTQEEEDRPHYDDTLSGGLNDVIAKCPECHSRAIFRYSATERSYPCSNCGRPFNRKTLGVA